ncbi:MAG: YlmC/YmxH family sporulation protein [Clostridia bacterium]|nr:YlmC/YmxH family sporulation protein [Clostridia bacterium]
MKDPYRLSRLQTKDVIGLRDGKNYGKVFDVALSADDGQISHIIVPGAPKFFGLLGREPDLEIAWAQIRLIGQDAILIDLPEADESAAISQVGKDVCKRDRFTNLY